MCKHLDIEEKPEKFVLNNKFLPKEEIVSTHINKKQGYDYYKEELQKVMGRLKGGYVPPKLRELS